MKAMIDSIYRVWFFDHSVDLIAPKSVPSLDTNVRS